MIQTRDEFVFRKAVLDERLSQIYKRGSLGTVQVLLGARSFTDLINRYKYLRLVALQDRLIMGQVQQLEAQLSEQRELLATELAGIQRLRREKVSEVDRLEELEQQRQRSLSRIRSRETAAQNRLSQLARDEERLRQLVVDLEEARREAERLAGAVTTPTLRTADLGNLAYTATKHAAVGLAEWLAVTYRERGIGISCLCPMGVHTAMLAQADALGHLRIDLGQLQKRLLREILGVGGAHGHAPGEVVGEPDVGLHDRHQRAAIAAFPPATPEDLAGSVHRPNSREPDEM